MKVFCKGRYANPPANLFFERAGIYDLDESKVQFLLRDAPDNFSLVLPDLEPTSKAPDAPTLDKMLHEPPRKKSKR